MDETPAPVLDPGRGKVKKGYFWALARDDRGWNGPEPPGVAFTYTPGRSGQHAVEILQGFEGVLQVDGYAGYNRVLDLRDNAPIQLAYCWAHARRKLYELTHHNVAPIAEEGLKQIAALYRIEAQVRGTSAEERLATRQQKSTPKVATFKIWLDHARTQVSAKSPTGLALKYIAKYWDGLILFLTDGRIEMDSNAVERTIRPIALQRKNALFAGHDAGAQNWAMLASLIETCKLNKIEPHSYLTGVLTAIVNGHKQKHIDHSCCHRTTPHRWGLNRAYNKTRQGVAWYGSRCAWYSRRCRICGVICQTARAVWPAGYAVLHCLQFFSHGGNFARG